MNPTDSPLLLAFVISASFGGTASAATALIDFGTNNTPAYNSVVANAVAVPLTDTMSLPTTWMVSVTNIGSGGMGNAGAGANVSSFPAAVAGFETTALQDSIFANQGTGTNPAMRLTIEGLSPAFTYDLLLYGSRANAQGVDQRWSITQGSGPADVDHFSELNDTVVVDWPGVSPNAMGVIEITINSPGPDNLGALALNFGSITEVVPEPSAALLAGMAGLALVARRRR